MTLNPNFRKTCIGLVGNTSEINQKELFKKRHILAGNILDVFRQPRVKSCLEAPGIEPRKCRDRITIALRFPA